VLHELEKDRDSRLAAQNHEIEKLNLEIRLLKQKVDELVQKLELTRKAEVDNGDTKSEVEKVSTGNSILLESHVQGNSVFQWKYCRK
jgi:predicted RNase H-like nuclease (RuvC/YqgF family)